jgi:hypothetical protein
MPQGTNWLVNSSSVAKYANKTAPSGGGVKVSVIKPGSLVKVVGKSLGDTPLDISSAPTGAVYVADTIVNDGEETRLCTQFTGCVHKVIAKGTGNKLICKGSSEGDPGCTAAGSPSTTTTVTSTTTSTTATTIFAGPAFPPVGGTVNFGFTGNSPDPGGADVSLFNFSPSSWTALYWGPFDQNAPAAGLDGQNHVLSTFLGISGVGDTVATWEGTSPWTDPGDMTVYNVPIRFTLTIVAGGLSFEPSTGIPGLDPGPGTGIDVAIDVAPGGTATDFTTNWAFTADIPTDGSGFIPLSTVPTLGGGLLVTSFGGGFYSQP